MRLITDDGKQLGIVTRQQALEEAEKRNLDLVEVAPGAQPPVCRIIDYSKYRYEQTRREKDSRKQGQKTRTKEIKFRPGIDSGDLEIKRKHILEFLADGYHVRVVCFHKGREAAHQEMGQELLERLTAEIKDFGAVEIPVKKMGANYTIVFGPLKTKKPKEQ